MSIHLDDEGKPSATRAVVFAFVALACLVVLGDVFFGYGVEPDVYDLLKAVLLVLVGAMATRSSVKYWRAPAELEVEEDLVADGQYTIGYDTTFPDEMGWDEEGGVEL